MSFHWSDLRRLPLARALLAVIAAQLVLLALLISLAPAPQIDTAFGSATVELSADRAWTILPGQCATVRWALDGIASVYVNGEGKVGHGEMAFCPTPSSMTLRFDITAAGGEERNFVMIIQGLPAALQAWLLFLGLLLPLLIAIYYLARMRLEAPSITDLSPFLLAGVLLLSGLLLQTMQPDFIASVMDRMAYVVKQRPWHVFGIVLAGIVYIPLAVQALRRGRQRGMRSVLIAITAFLVVLLLLMLTGVESIAQWEIWNTQSFLEGRESLVRHEVTVRFWLLAPHALAMAISPDSFAGYHVVNFFMFWASLAMFYAVLRQMRVPPWLAFLATILFLFYPINAALISIRSISITLGKLALLTAVYLILECRENPSRLRLLGIWLALLFNVGTYEVALVIILVIPLLWWLREPRRHWLNINLTAVWYLVAIAKAAQVLLLLIFKRSFYGEWFVSGSGEVGQVTLDMSGEILLRAVNAYRHTFLDGWQDALNAISQNTWAVSTIATLALTGLAAAILIREADDDIFPPPKKTAKAMMAGFLFVLPSIGVLIWSKSYAADLWRMFVYAPIGAAIAVIGLLILLSASVKQARRRQAFIVCCSLLLIWPGLSRLYLQQEQQRAKADAKASILKQIVEQAPGFNSGANLMLFTTMKNDQLGRKGISALYLNTFHSAIYMLYQAQGPLVSFLCIYGKNCSRYDIEIMTGNRDFLGDDEDYADVVMFQLHDDLSVELLRELPPELREREINRYDPERLIDASAPIPPRARSLLASVWNE